jgi:phosphomannomutase/phosphoglucomutase
MPIIAPHIFRAYDIRGKAGTQITEEACRLIGRAFGEEVAKRSGNPHPTIIVGRDARLSSPMLLEALKDGLRVAGCGLQDIGETPSPVNYFTICRLNADGGAHITASHNPGSDNGIKLQLKDAEAFAGEDLQRLRESIEKNAKSKEPETRNQKPETEGMDAISPYLENIQKMFGDIGKGMTVVIDCGNGVAGPVYVQALKNAGCKVIELYTEPDGNFPNHPADPSKHSTLKDLQATVVKEKAHLGLAFDGDGDRLGIVDETGKICSADEILLLLARDHLMRHKGAPVIFTVSNSSILDTEIRKYGGKPVMCKVGHSFVEHAMREHGALLGGEQSGHFFCGEDYYGFDDALVAALRVLQIFSSNPQPATRNHNDQLFSGLFSEFPQVFQSPELRPHCPDDRKGEIIKAITKHFQGQYPVNTLDGVRIDFGDGAWAGIRQSNTSPCISVCMEARSAEKLEEVEGIVLGHFRSYEELKDM